MSKQSSKEYTEFCKKNILDKCQYPKDHKSVVFGCGKTGYNIGSNIASRIKADALTIDDFDVTNEDHINNFKWSNYDTFIFNNGVTHLDWIEDQPNEKIDEVISSILTGNIKSVSKLVEKTIDEKYIKTIIFIGSMAHNHVLNASAPYCAAKAGLQMFAKCISYELAPKGYRVYCVNPSNVQDAPMSDATISGLMRFRSITKKEASEYWAAECNMGTFLTMDEICSTVEYLMTYPARYLSGTEINLNGGGR